VNRSLLAKHCPAVNYKPNTPASEEFILKHGGLPGTKSTGDWVFFENAHYPIRGTLGANRAAKTTKLVMEAGSQAIGIRPFVPLDHPLSKHGIKQGRPLRIRFVVPNFGEQLPEVINAFEKWWPKDWWRAMSRDDRGVPRAIEFFNGSRIMFMSHHQDASDFEGIEADLVAWDEPPPADIWVRLQRGLVSTGGRSIIGATLLDATEWFWQELVAPAEAGSKDIFISWHSIWDNTAENGGCPEQEADNVRRWLDGISDPDERMAREHGYPMHVGGLVLGALRDHALVDPFDLPDSAYIVSCIDPAGAKPYAGLHCAIIENHETNEIEGHAFDETLIPQAGHDLGSFAQLFRDKEDGKTEPRHPRPSSVMLIDPIAEEVQRADRLTRTLSQILNDEYGLYCVPASRKGKRARLLTLNNRIRVGKWKVWNTLTRLRMEARKWSWDPKSPKLTKGPDDVLDCFSYIDHSDPFTMFNTADGESHEGIWVPEEYRLRDELRGRLRRANRERYHDYEKQGEWRER